MIPIDVRNLNKTYKGNFQALKNINLHIKTGEIFALLGPNGAGKTTLINTICGIVRPTNGTITVDGHDIITDFRAARSLIGLVPQELATDAFETVWHTVNFSRGLFGLAPNRAYVEKIIRQLSLWDKKNNKIMTLSGGMKRRVMIAKALSHEPKILFLDEPSAGVDVSLRKDMWENVRTLRDSGVTIILTTHYLEEAEEMADRISVINKGEIILTDNKDDLMKKLGHKTLTIDLDQPLNTVPPFLSAWKLDLDACAKQLHYHYSTAGGDTKVPQLLAGLSKAGIAYKDIHTNQSSLEEIFIELIK
ncbi:MAG: ABC transporter ATP-binding protein [Candidatus Omnitrophica bacterium]|nr:ABC transporter ATP-binding protein [Candidatus Omnitrophota bacterium]MDE2008709.1 ABC transporter ATP-binding protein [Candidatus Omnitrophota bacterium]MDE2214850.1 ABC transporter ATP-binding protein [Candidatus Omnitrophota bacterium]MDE2231970.1 ABC transporter ATP-binding protein [Candidatus Omnitrophota bacterium]